MLFFFAFIDSFPTACWQCLSFDLFQIHFISFAKRKANSSIEQQKCMIREKRDRLLLSKMELNYQLNHPIYKFKPFDPVFSIWGNLSKKGQHKLKWL